MFLANVLTVWSEALTAIFANHPNPELNGISIHTDYPMAQVDYPGIWLNFTVAGEVHSAGLGHTEHVLVNGDTHEVLRWRFSGSLDMTVGALGNLERALLVDEITTNIAVARTDENREGVLREDVERNDLVGMIVEWESFSVSGFAEVPGTPWGTDEVVYEATISLGLEGEVVLDPATGVLVPLSAVVFTPMFEDDPALPAPSDQGWT